MHETNFPSSSSSLRLFFCTTHVASQFKAHLNRTQQQKREMKIIISKNMRERENHLLEYNPIKSVSGTATQRHLIAWRENSQNFSKFSLTLSLSRRYMSSAAIKIIVGTYFYFLMKNKKFKRFYFLDDNIFSDFFCDTFFFLTCSRASV